ncbi:RNA polymerase sigma factor [Steroidobacter sp.]|uniref:RNA polymerase sigma factor n=1 Tax=Steroidobacter sp. TaxID=1978227 RepID=UPI001A619605|nr:sigma-70 family RNA polymerase sigma factor [Steroidobacter sp.]MBL8268733.1 sigma-70 family RNA polymerase sigma factor [Steroidobacter sp.]
MEKQAFDRLSRTFRPGLMAFFLRRVGNRAEAEDLTQEVFARLAGMNREQMQSAEAYIFSMAGNLLRDRQRREKVRFEYRVDALASESVGIDQLDPLRVAVGREILADLGDALSELPEATRTAFILYRLENVDKRAIAAALRMSVSSVDRHLSRAISHLIQRVREKT